MNFIVLITCYRDDNVSGYSIKLLSYSALEYKKILVLKIF